MRIVVVGSGVSGAHAALTLLERGHAVEMWDMGRVEADFPEPAATFHELKNRLPDPAAYFLGQDLAAMVPPAASELMRYPPSRQFLSSDQDPFWPFLSDGFIAYGSFAKGGLANGWGANALCFDANDIADWPVSISELESAYRTVCNRIPIAGPADDDLSEDLRSVRASQPPLRLTRPDERLLRNYARRRTRLNRIGAKLGRARLAVVTDHGRNDACVYCNRCLWGCPRGSIYNPRTSTLEQCQQNSAFRYVAHRYVISLGCVDGRISGIRYLDAETSEVREESCDVVFLAAGALQTGAIFLRTLKKQRVATALETDGLMDTSFLKIPYLVPGSIGTPEETQAFQFNRLILGITTEMEAWPRYLHVELLNLTSLVYHPLIERLPLDTQLSKRLFFALKSALGAATLFFPDKIAASNHESLVEGDGPWDRIQLSYRESEAKLACIRDAAARIRSVLRMLGCIVREPVQSPPGAAIHYAGTVPMGQGPKRCDGNGRSNLYSNLYIADGAAFPSLPSKSITLSLAAHATRVARNAQL